MFTSFQSARKLFVSGLVILLQLVIVSCRDTPDPQPEPDKYLVEAVKLGEVSKQEIEQLASSFPQFGNFVQHGVFFYKIVYKTKDTNGSEIRASGAVAIPLANKKFPMASIQHGTIADGTDGPSSYNQEYRQLGSLFAGLGYICVFPDYIGYGVSSLAPHPYEHRESLGQSSLDMLRAVKELLGHWEDEPGPGDMLKEFRTSLSGTSPATDAFGWNAKLYITGYSEGGYATLSLQKMLEQDAAGEFDLRASTCGAGAYNKSAFMSYLINNETQGKASDNRLYIWVILSYNRIYGLNLSLWHIFKESYAYSIEKSQQNARLSGSFHEMLRPEFVKGIKEGTEQKFIQAIADNDLLGWKPVTPTQLYHGTDDQTVFYFNSETLYESVKAMGATKVELKPLAGQDHYSAVPYYVVGTFMFFNQNP